MRRSLWIICAGVVVLLALLLLPRKALEHSTVLPEHRDASNSVLNSAEERAISENQDVAPPLRGLAAPRTRTLDDSNAIAADRLAIWQEQRLAIWQAPIEFYGKVVDESGSPVEGADISFNWMEFPTEDGSREATARSDAEGLFSLRNARGPSLSVFVSREGYYTSRSGRQGFKFGPLSDGDFMPDPRNPVIFRLRKKGQGAQLLTSDKGMRLNLSVRVPMNGAPVRVDLLEKRASPTGQLEVSQIKPPWREATEWSFRLSMADGGLVENQDEFQFEAPEANYLPDMEYHFAKGETNWTTQVNKQFYIVFGQPRKYGWLRIESNLAQETAFLTYAINPSGSRNLEPR
jgi:hypothetical protein